MANEINIDINDDNEDITISTDETVNNVSETVGGDPYYTDLAREWAIKMGNKVLGEDYSSKYYATQAKADRIHIDNVITDNIDAINTLEENLDTITAVYNDLDNIDDAIVSAENAEIWAEGTDEEVQALGGTHSAKVWAENTAQDLTTKVNKSGDTMTGNLTIQKNRPHIHYIDNRIDFTENPQEGIVTDFETLVDANGVLMAELQHVYNTDGSHYAKLQSRKSAAENNTYAYIRVGYDVNGREYATAPNPLSTSNSTNIATTSWVRGYGADNTLSNVATISNSSAVKTALDAKQETLVSGTNIKTLNGSSILGSGNINFANKTLSNVTSIDSNSAVKTALDAKQETLVSGTNIKTINGNSLLGSGDIVIQGGGGGTVDQTFDGTSQNAQSGVAVNDALTGGTVNPVFDEQIMFANQTSIQSLTDEGEGINALSLSANVVEAASDDIYLNGEVHIGNGYIRSYEEMD